MIMFLAQCSFAKQFIMKF